MVMAMKYHRIKNAFNGIIPGPVWVLPSAKYTLKNYLMHAYWLIELPSVHITPLMSGYHSPFITQMAEFGPVSNISEGQVKLIIVPSSIGRLSSS